jgi:serine protease Do
MQMSFAPLVKRTAPAVVNIFSKKIVRQQANPLANNPFFQEFFQRFGGQMPGGLGQERVQNSLGSGVIVRPDGLVVTNHHVIKEADQITVVLADRREFEAKIVRLDERTDLAVLKIEAKEALPVLAFGDSDALEVGDLVLAIGNPFGVGQTVTQGIVSALARTQTGISDYGFFIQTDAAINPGNSGGALVDMSGRIIGVNSAIYSRSGGSVGIGFDIPADVAESVTKQLISGGKVTRGFIGATVQDASADMAESVGLGERKAAICRPARPNAKGPGGPGPSRSYDKPLRAGG